MARKIKGFWSYGWYIVRQWHTAWIAGALTGSIYAITWIRDNVFGESIQHKYATQRFIHLLNWQTWLAVLFCALLLSSIWNGYRVWRDQQLELDRLRDRFADRTLPSTAPELKLLPYGIALRLKNISTTDRIYRLELLPITLSDGVFLRWHPGSIPVMESREEETIVAQYTEGDVHIESLGEIAGMLYRRAVNPNIHRFKFATLELTCEDRSNNRYIATSELFFQPQIAAVDLSHFTIKLAL